MWSSGRRLSSRGNPKNSPIFLSRSSFAEIGPAFPRDPALTAAADSAAACDYPATAMECLATYQFHRETVAHIRQSRKLPETVMALCHLDVNSTHPAPQGLRG